MKQLAIRLPLFLALVCLPLIVLAEPTAAQTQEFQETKALAEKGDVNAQYKLAGMYTLGVVTPKNDVEAVTWFRKAAEQNDPRGQSMLGVMYTNARGVERDYTEAIKWFNKAAAQKSAHAQYNLGHMYSTGKGVKQDNVESANWYRKAAEQNDANSQRILGNLYLLGRGVPKDLVHAHAWTSVYAAKGNEPAKKEVLKFEEQMTPAQIAEAKKLAQEISDKLALLKK